MRAAFTFRAGKYRGEQNMITTYSINIHPGRIFKTDEAIGRFLAVHDTADVEDALDAIFQRGVDAMLSFPYQEESTI